jgi:hypothetical protein
MSQKSLVRGWISVYSVKNGAGNRMDFRLRCQKRDRQQMDFSLVCLKRCRQQDGFNFRVQKSVQATGWISV